MPMLGSAVDSAAEDDGDAVGRAAPPPGRGRMTVRSLSSGSANGSLLLMAT
jgi:hypothetical protein